MRRLLFPSSDRHPSGPYIYLISPPPPSLFSLDSPTLSQGRRKGSKGEKLKSGHCIKSFSCCRVRSEATKDRETSQGGRIGVEKKHWREQERNCVSRWVELTTQREREKERKKGKSLVHTWVSAVVIVLYSDFCCLLYFFTGGKMKESGREWAYGLFYGRKSEGEWKRVRFYYRRRWGWRSASWARPRRRPDRRRVRRPREQSRRWPAVGCPRRIRSACPRPPRGPLRPGTKWWGGRSARPVDIPA